jgi:hypothetical protein
MNRTKTLWMSPFGAGIVVGLLLLTVLALSGCADPVAIAAVPPTAALYAPLPTKTPQAAPGATPVAMAFPLAAPTQESAEGPGDDQSCVDCHKDEAQLKDTAEKVVAAESLSEGEG